MSIVAEPLAPQSADDVARIDPAPRRLLSSALVVGFTLEVGLRGGMSNAAVAVAVVLTVLLLLTDGRLARREARIAAALAVIPAVFLGVRASPWLAWSNALAVAALLSVAVVHAHRGSFFDSRPGLLVARGVSGLVRGLAALDIVRLLARQMSAGQRDGVVRVSRGLLVVVPVLLVLVALLASADAVFASLLTPDLEIGPVAGHVMLTLLAAPVVVVLAGATSAGAGGHRRHGTFGVIEITTMLGLVGTVLALFVVSQLVAVTGAGDRLIESAGLTPAEYARSGFFQLCWATGLLLAFLTVVRALADPEALRQPIVIGLGAAVPTLALGLVVVSLRRMALYDDAFGLTMLRLWVVGAAIWMGAVLVMTAARNLGAGAGREWLTAGSGLAALSLVVVANLADPEALVARHNLDRAREGADLDIDYLSTLSDDVVPVIADAVDGETDPGRQQGLRLALRCADDAVGVATLNLSVERAIDLREEHCAS